MMEKVVPDCVRPGELAAAEVEKAYRRGFAQGVLEALDGLGRGATVEELHAWLLRVLRWRRVAAAWKAGARVKVKPPPDLTPCAAERAANRKMPIDFVLRSDEEILAHWLAAMRERFPDEPSRTVIEAGHALLQELFSV
jgi:hypothetical protein